MPSELPPTIDEITTTLTSILFAQARDRADAIAVDDGRQRITYGELAGRASAMGERLDAAALPPGPIGILLPVAIDYIAAIFAVLATGRAYVPMDARFPAARNDLIARHAGLVAVVGDTASEIAPDLPRIAQPPRSSVAAFRPRDVPTDIAAVFYTSGSTGEPKGVYYDQRSILYEALRYARQIDLAPADRVSLIYSPSVSGSLRDIFGAVVAGARLCVVDVAKIGLKDLAPVLAGHDPTIVHAVPTLFRALMAGDEASKNRLARSTRLVHLISDRVLPSDVALYKSCFSRAARLAIDLATTETLSNTSWFLDHDTVVDTPLVPVGRPREDRLLSFVNDDGVEVPVGEAGEMIVTGRSLAIGYWHDEAQTRARFAPSQRMAGAIAYRTGDIGRLESNGLVQFLGRKDRQVKVRGTSVHLAEIESVLGACPLVGEAAVVSRGEGADLSLVAYCSPASGDPATLSTDELRIWCREHLPAAMRPVEITILKSLPKLANAKPDLIGLKRLDEELRARSAQLPTAAPRSATKIMQAVGEVWDTILGSGAFARDEKLEDAGGDSLKALQLLLLLEQRLDRHVASALLAADTRPSELVDRLRQASAPVPRDGAPMLLFFPGIFGTGFGTGYFRSQIEPGIALLTVDYDWAGNAVAEALEPERFFAELLKQVREAGPPKRLWVMGYSWGCRIAAEAVRRLGRAGIAVEFVCLLDGFADPAIGLFSQPSIDKPRSRLIERVRRNWREQGRHYPIMLVSWRLASILNALHARRSLTALLRFLTRFGFAAAFEATWKQATLENRSAAFAAMSSGPIPQEAILMVTTPHRYPDQFYPYLGWDRHFASVNTIELAVPHMEMLSAPHSEAIIDLLRRMAAR
jgi:amino acid adenylation domain-containing protein